jgi:lipopolysaccharide export LptBFGC system permease protein LptF
MIFFELAKLTGLSAGVLVVIIAIGAAIKPLSDGLLEAGDAAIFVSLAMVPMLAFVLPFAAGFASTLTYHRLATSNETTAAYASGLSHRAILMPAAVMGLTLALIVSGLNEQVIPRFLLQMQKLITVDVSRLLAQEISRGKPVRLEDTIVFADRAERVPPGDGGAVDQVIFTNFAAIRLDDKGEPVQEVTARNATMWLFPPGAAPGQTTSDESAPGRSDSSLVVLELDEVIAADPSGLGGFRDGATAQFNVPSVLKDNPKFLTTGQLAALKTAPERMNWIESRRKTLANELGQDIIWVAIAEQLNKNGEANFADARNRDFTIKAVKLGAPALIDGKVRVPVLGRGGSAIEVFHSRSGDRGDVQLHTLAREGTLRIDDRARPGSLLLELKEVRTREVTSQNSFAQSPERSQWQAGNLLVTPNPAATLTQTPTFTLLDQARDRARTAPADSTLRKAYIDLEKKTGELLREATSKQHERIAMSLSVLVVTICGAVTALRLSQRLPLTTYLWTFIPGVITLVTISGGQQLTEQLGLPGLLLMYGGVLGLAIYTLLQYRVVGKH